MVKNLFFGALVGAVPHSTGKATFETYMATNIIAAGLFLYGLKARDSDFLAFSLTTLFVNNALMFAETFNPSPVPSFQI